jgi:hypothetical protein
MTPAHHHRDRQVVPGLRVYRVGGHTAGLRIVSVHTARGRDGPAKLGRGAHDLRPFAEHAEAGR